MIAGVGNDRAGAVRNVSGLGAKSSSPCSLSERELEGASLGDQVGQRRSIEEDLNVCDLNAVDWLGELATQAQSHRQVRVRVFG
ncbi:hypothetical protein [Streptomyces noursei]